MDMYKFQSQAPPITESLQAEALERVVGALFPCDSPDFLLPEMSPTPCRARSQAPSTPPLDANKEMEIVVEHLHPRRRAPGPDGFSGYLLALALGHMGSALWELFDRFSWRGGSA